MRKLCHQIVATQIAVIQRFRLVYKLEIGEAGVRIARGRPPAAFLHAVRDIVRLHGIVSGAIECKGLGRHARLRFIDGFPERGRQAIRNVWSPPTRPGGPGGKREAGA